ncbi:MAG: 7TM diverse intracellular signaling domain-containing protein [Bacteroidota bacterium]
MTAQPRLPQFLKIFVFLLCCLPFKGAAQETAVLSDKAGKVVLGKHLEILEDKAGKLTIANVSSPENSGKFLKSKEDVPGYGLTKSAFWVRFTVVNSLEESAEWLLELSYPVLDEAQLYTAQLDGSFKKVASGDKFPFSMRELKHRNIIFRLPLEKNTSNTYYMRLQTSGSVQIPLTLWSMQAFIAKDHEEQIVLGLYYGIMLIMVLYNLSVFIFLRDRTYVSYTGYLVFFTLFQMTINGLSFEYLWPQSPWWANKALMFSAFAFQCFALIFTKEFLNTKVNTPKLNKFITWQMYSSLLLIALSLFIEYSVLIRIAIAMAFPFVGMVIAAAILSLKNGYRPARFYVSAWAVFVAGLFIFVLKTVGVLPNNLITQYGVQVGSALEVVLLSVALADRISILKRDKEKAEREALNAEIYRLKNVEIAQALEKVQMLNERLVDSQEETEALNKNLLEANQYLTELNNEKNEFLGIAAHDLKNPLAAIILSSEILSRYYDRFSKEKILDKIKSIETTATRMRDIVSNLLDVNAIESGKINISLEVLDIVSIARQLSEEYRERANAKNISIVFKTQLHSLTVKADKHALQEVLDNLISNAIKYSPHGKSVTISIEKSVLKTAVLKVQDEGPGLNDDDKQKLFGKFARLSALPTGGESSTGLGLSIVKKLSEAMNAKIWCESEPGHGAAFLFEIPLANEAEITHSIPDTIRALEEKIKTLSLETERIDALNSLAMYKSKIDPQEALKICDETYRLSEKMGYTIGLATSIQHAATCYWRVGLQPAAIAKFEESAAIFKKIGDVKGEASSFNRLSTVYYDLGNYPKSLQYAQQSQAMFEASGDEFGVAASHNNIGNAFKNMGEHQRALKHYLQSLKMHEENGNRQSQSFALNNIGNLYSAMGEHERALNYQFQSLEIKRELGDKFGEASSLNNIGSYYAHLGDNATALDYHFKSLDLRRKIGDKKGEALTLLKLGGAFVRQEDNEKALEYLAEALAIFRAIGNTMGEASCLTETANILLKTGKVNEAIGLLKESLEIVTESNAKSDERKIHITLAEAYEAIGDGENAVKHRNKSQETTSISVQSF